MDRQPVLEGERLYLRPLTESDWPALFAVASDRELWANHPSHDRWLEPALDKLRIQRAYGGSDRERIEAAIRRIQS